MGERNGTLGWFICAYESILKNRRIRDARRKCRVRKTTAKIKKSTIKIKLTLWKRKHAQCRPGTHKGCNKKYLLLRNYNLVIKRRIFHIGTHKWNLQLDNAANYFVLNSAVFCQRVQIIFDLVKYSNIWLVLIYGSIFASVHLNFIAYLKSFPWTTFTSRKCTLLHGKQLMQRALHLQCTGCIAFNFFSCICKPRVSWQWYRQRAKLAMYSTKFARQIEIRDFSN